MIFRTVHSSLASRFVPRAVKSLPAGHGATIGTAMPGSSIGAISSRCVPVLGNAGLYSCFSTSGAVAQHKRRPIPASFLSSPSPTRSPFHHDEKNKVDETARKIRNIDGFIDQIPLALNRRKLENIEPGHVDDPVATLFRRLDLPPEAWYKYALFDDDKPYTRNLISTDNETYTLLLLCWNPQNESPIHDHPCDGCWLQVLEGNIVEVRYDKKLRRVSDVAYNEGQLSYITNNSGYHKVCATNDPAVTLHLYSPPFDSCHCWYSDTADPLEPSRGWNINHSEYGIVKAA